MKNHLATFCIVFSILVGGCGESDTPAIKPITSFLQDRIFIEPGEVVTFTNTSQNGATYLWDFGDNTTSIEENPIHEYQALGEYIVRLTVISSTGDRIATTSGVLVGSRWALGIRVDTINFLDSNDDPWDDDDTGPDLLINFFKAKDLNSEFLLNFGNDYVESDFPAGGTLPPEFLVMFTDEDWQLVFYDNEIPLSVPLNSTEMARFTFNPMTIETQKDYDLGGGVFTIENNGYRFSLLFQIR